jgi:drug/metabolite transporter (DMT)-like permease
MSSLAIVLIILSAFMHAGWNLLSKSQIPSSSFFGVACLTGAILFSPTLILYQDQMTSIPLNIWGFLILTGFFQALYYASLAGAYRNGDISVAYPISRSAPIIVVTVTTLIFGHGDQVSNICVAGILLVVTGCFLIPLERFTEFHLKKYLNPSCGLALLAAAGTSGYSLIDDEALRQLRTFFQTSMGNTEISILYICLEAAMSALWLFLFVVFRSRGRRNLIRVVTTGIGKACLAGIGIHLTYVIILISLAFVDNVTYVVGFRQLSIPLGVTLGILILKEKPFLPKITGVVIMFTGLIMIAVG